MKNIRIVFYLFFLSFLLFSCKSKKVFDNISCKGKIEFQKEWLESDKADTDHVIVNPSSDYFAVHFVGNYNNDTLRLFINNRLYTKINIEETSEEKNNYAVTFSRTIEPDIHILRIESVKKKNCFEIKFDSKYPLMYVWFKDDKWIVRYSNFYHSDNLKN